MYNVFFIVHSGNAFKKWYEMRMQRMEINCIQILKKLKALELMDELVWLLNLILICICVKSKRDLIIILKVFYYTYLCLLRWKGFFLLKYCQKGFCYPKLKIGKAKNNLSAIVMKFKHVFMRANKSYAHTRCLLTNQSENPVFFSEFMYIWLRPIYSFE